MARVLVLLILMVIVTVHAGKHTDPRKVKPIPPQSSIIGDGNCFYRAVAQYWFGDQELHGYIRQVIMNFMSEREDEYRRFTDYDHNGDYGSFLRQHRQERVWADAGIVQATADCFGFSIYVSVASQIARARSDQGGEGWLHLRLEENHYDDIISDSSQEGAVEPQNAVDLHDMYSLITTEHGVDDLDTRTSKGGKVIPDGELPEINNPLPPEDADNDICNDFQDISLTGKEKIDTALFEKLSSLCRTTQNLDLKTFPSVENLGRLDNQYVELEGEEETPGEISEPTQINEVLSSSEEEKTNTEVPSDKKPDKKDSLLIEDLNHLRSLIENGEVQFGSHFRVTRRRCFFEYHHHYFIKEADDKSLTVVHVTNTQKYHVYMECKEENISFSDCSDLLDFASGVELLYKYEIPTNESALEAINLRMQHMLSLDFVNYSLTSRIHNKINCASLVSYILTGEKDHSDVHDFIHRYGIFAILLILSVECICSCFLIYQIKFRKNVLSKLKGKLINRFGIAKLQITDWMYSLFGIVNNCIFHPVVKLWIILMKNVFKRKRDGKKG